MNIDVVNHRLELSAEEFRNMGESISYTTVGKYAVYEEIGVGGFGKVYKGFDEETQQDVAIKVIDIAKIYEESNARLR
jgi:serine/threonine protein kinase